MITMNKNDTFWCFVFVVFDLIFGGDKRTMLLQGVIVKMFWMWDLFYNLPKRVAEATLQHFKIAWKKYNRKLTQRNPNYLNNKRD